jgi:hypothetical protein
VKNNFSPTGGCKEPPLEESARDRAVKGVAPIVKGFTGYDVSRLYDEIVVGASRRSVFPNRFNGLRPG